MPDYTINCKHFFGHNCDYLITRNMTFSQRHTFAITTDITLRVFARYDCLIQIKAPVDVYKLSNTAITLCLSPCPCGQGLRYPINFTSVLT